MDKLISRIVVLGSLGFDHIMQLKAPISDFIMPDMIDRLNVSFTVDSLRKEFGGTGGNCAYVLGILGMKPLLVAAWGQDAEAYREHLEAVGVDVSHIMVDPNVFSAWGHVMTDVNQNQIWMYYPGALSRMDEIDLAAIMQPQDLFVLMPSQPTAFIKHLHQVIELKAPFLFDPAFFVPNFSSDELKLGIEHATIVIGNEYEVDLMQKKTGTDLQYWLKEDKIVIQTLGDKGAMIWQGNQFYKIDPVKPEQVAEPTGAGDTFRAGFLAGYVKGLPIDVCGKMGALAATYCVEKPGTQTYGYTLEEFGERFKANYGHDLKFE